MKVIFLLALLSILYSCTTTTVSSYKLEGGEYNSWVHLDKDTIADIGFYISVLNNQPRAGSIFYREFKELSFYKEITLTLDGVKLNGIKEDSMNFELGEASGSDRAYFSGKNLSSVMPKILRMKKSGTYFLSSDQPYRGFPDPLPEKLNLKFHIITRDTIISGELSFVKVETQTEDVLRWH